MCLCDEHFQEFLQRDKKLTRAQLDAKAKNSFWHAAAITFCDASKTFNLMDFPGVDSDRYSSLKAGLLPTTYALTAEKAKKEFGDFRTLLTKIYQRFKVSGEGDNVDEECPRRQDQPSSPDLAKGARVWYHQLSEWLDAYVLAFNAETVRLQPVGRAVDEVTVRRQQVALEQPRDCGAMQPPQGLSGIMYWLERDPFIFANMNGIRVSRPRCLWEA